MEIARAREILDPEHREPYESLEPINEACRMGVEALRRRVPESPYPDGDAGVMACPSCGSGEYLHNEDGNRCRFCGQCGQAIDWDGSTTVYECVDREHDAWRCRACGYIENFEADGPTENGWHFCPGCGREIIVEAVNPCPFDNDNCMCQFCETPCNNGLNCSDCAHEGKTVHDVLLCTGFNGSMEQYTENWKRKQMEKLGGGQE